MRARALPVRVRGWHWHRQLHWIPGTMSAISTTTMRTLARALPATWDSRPEPAAIPCLASPYAGRLSLQRGSDPARRNPHQPGFSRVATITPDERAVNVVYDIPVLW